MKWRALSCCPVYAAARPPTPPPPLPSHPPPTSPPSSLPPLPSLPLIPPTPPTPSTPRSPPTDCSLSQIIKHDYHLPFYEIIFYDVTSELLYTLNSCAIPKELIKVQKAYQVTFFVVVPPDIFFRSLFLAIYSVFADGGRAYSKRLTNAAES
jgi:hypothetical protein